MTYRTTTALAATIALGILSFSATAIGHDHGKISHNKMLAPAISGAMPNTEKTEAKIPGKTKMPMMPKNGHGQGHHHHKKMAIPNGQPIPKVKLKVSPDSMGGWNMQIMLENFAFTPEKVNQESDPTNGHAHLMLNGKKIARLYGTWYHIPSLPSGNNTLSVVLNTNKHEELTDQGKPIAASVTIDVPTTTSSAN